MSIPRPLAPRGPARNLRPGAPRPALAGGRAPRAAAAAALALLLAGCAGQDKAAHFAAGVATSQFVAQQTGSQLAGCAAALGVGALKEALDSRTGGHVEAADALATGAGCAVTWEF